MVVASSACLVGIHFDIKYVVLGLIGSALLISFPALKLLSKQIGLSPARYVRPCVKPALSSLLMVEMIWLMASLMPASTPVAFRLFCKVMIGAIAYLGCMRLLEPSAMRKLINVIRVSLSLQRSAPSNKETKVSPALPQSDI
jgi:hypothetical protein